MLIDEADGLVGPAMVSFLTQIRQRYLDRSATPFPHSLALIGRREVRDYVLTKDDRRTMSWLGTSSPFNICAETPTLQPFSPAEVAALLQQHTAATGQVFQPAAVARIQDLSCGQPWLVNALADQIVRRDVRDRAQAVVAADVVRAKETIILERRSHIDTLIARLHEERVRRIIEPMLAGEQILPDATLDDDFAYVVGLGLVARRGGWFQIANPIYKEVIPRVLSYAATPAPSTRASPSSAPTWIRQGSARAGWCSSTGARVAPGKSASSASGTAAARTPSTSSAAEPSSAADRRALRIQR